MHPNRLDDVAKGLARTTSRREALKLLTLSAASGFFAVITRESVASADHNAQCRDVGANCRSNAECCTGVCTDFHCACPADLPNFCPGQEQCLESCSAPRIFNIETCECECPTEECPEPFVRNPNTCLCECPSGIFCPPGQSVNPATCECQCPIGTQPCNNTCCPNGTCSSCGPGSRPCCVFPSGPQLCANQTCSSSFECCSGACVNINPFTGRGFCAP